MEFRWQDFGSQNLGSTTKILDQKRGRYLSSTESRIANRTIQNRRPGIARISADGSIRVSRITVESRKIDSESPNPNYCLSLFRAAFACCCLEQLSPWSWNRTIWNAQFWIARFSIQSRRISATTRGPPDYSSNLCPPRTFAIWLLGGCFGPPSCCFSYIKGPNRP